MLPKLKDWNPTSWDSRSNYMGTNDYDEWFVVPCILTRDACLIEESNWHIACERLRADKKPTVQIVRFGHWACGHYELILIDPCDHDSIVMAESMADDLKAYPILSEDHYSQLQQDAISKAMHDDYLPDFRSKIELDYPVQLDDVTEGDLWAYFDECASKANVYFEDHDSSGMWIDLSAIVSEVDLVSLIKQLPGLLVDRSALDALPHAVMHDFCYYGVGVKTLEGELWTAPDFIAVQYDKRQVKLID